MFGKSRTRNCCSGWHAMRTAAILPSNPRACTGCSLHIYCIPTSTTSTLPQHCSCVIILSLHDDCRLAADSALFTK
jgi:hypothetical protein